MVSNLLLFLLVLRPTNYNIGEFSAYIYSILCSYAEPEVKVHSLLLVRYS